MAQRGVDSLFTSLGCQMWSITPYGLCDFRCVYCCTGVQGTSRPLITVEDATAETRRRVAGMPSAHCLLIGALSDAYPPPESEFGITRAIVATLVAASERFTIVTKSELVLRDIDLLAAHADQAYVQVSICSTDDDVLRRLDPGAPTGTARFGVIAALRAAGVRVGLNVLPWIPGVTDTQALIARVPDDVEIVLAPLAFGEGRDRMRLLGREFTRHDVVEQYLDEYRRFGHVANTSWVRPSPPPEENHPMHRLPSLAVSA